MKISIITPTFNSSKTIEKCTRSILDQTFSEYEHIIIDNCSNDNTLEIIQGLYNSYKKQSNLHIISEKDNGISEAFNKGILNSKGDIISILNSDDYYSHKNVLTNIADKFREENCLFVHGNILFIDNRYGSNIRRPLRCDIRKAMPYNHPTMFISKKIYDIVGLYDTYYKYAMDYEFVCRLSNKYKNLDNISSYINDKPIVVMNAGGASWKYEKDTLGEVKLIQTDNGLWSIYSQYFYLITLIKINLKQILNVIGLNILTQLWRKVKWQ